MKSLFIVSLPRTGSSIVHINATRMLKLREPTWVTQGEILNVDRLVFYKGDLPDQVAMYVTPEADPKRFEQIQDFLSDATNVENFAYKDVVNPFVMAAWPGMQNFNVLKIHRNVVDVVYSMLRRKWSYPSIADPLRDPDAPEPVGLEMEKAVTRGILRAQQTLASIPGEVVDYDDMIIAERMLIHALRDLYPEEEVAPDRYIDDARFRQKREEALEHRSSSRYTEVEAMVDECRQSLES